MPLYTDFTSVETTKTDTGAINNAIKNILFTRIGSIPGKPTFGSKLHQIIFSQMDHITENITQRYIKEALVKWEPRIIVSKIKIKAVPEFNRLVVTLTYKYRDKGLEVSEQLSLNLLQ
jgi:uncharacterized protein